MADRAEWAERSPFEGNELVEVPFFHQLSKVLVAKQNRLPTDVFKNELFAHILQKNS